METALGQAIVQKPSAIVLGGFDATEQADLVEQANKAGITVVGWHAAGTPGPQSNPTMFTNVTTPAQDTSEAAAYLAIANSNGRAGVVIFTDSAYAMLASGLREVLLRGKTLPIVRRWVAGEQ